MQDLAAKEADAIYRLIVSEEGHIYVCGDVTMAEHVYLTIRYVANNNCLPFLFTQVSTTPALLAYLCGNKILLLTNST